MARIAQAAQKQSSKAQSGRQSHQYSVISSRNPPVDKKWAFGFQYFRQIEYFGLDASSIKSTWLISVMERFSELCGTNVEDLIGNKDIADANRCHLINWDQKNIPVQKEDLDWIPERFRSDESPIIQFAVSKSLGRVIGFFDNDWTFQLVLLDPLHNIQPTKSYDYKVNLCGPLGCEFTALRKNVDAAVRSSADCDCGVAKRLSELVELPAKGTAQIICISREDLPADIDDVFTMNLATDFQDILAAGVDACLERQRRVEESENCSND